MESQLGGRETAIDSTTGRAVHAQLQGQTHGMNRTALAAVFPHRMVVNLGKDIIAVRASDRPETCFQSIYIMCKKT